MNSSPTHPEMDTLGANKSASSVPLDPVPKFYSTNPYWKRKGDKPDPPFPVNEKPVIDDSPLPTHLIAALEASLEKAHQAQSGQLRQDLNDWLLTMPQNLTPAVELYFEKMLPKVVRVEQPGQVLHKLVRYLTVGMVVAGLTIGGLLFGWLQACHQRDTFAVGYWQHRYLLARARVDRSAMLMKLLHQTDTLQQTPAFPAELNRLERIIDARQQQYQLRLQEEKLVRDRK